MMPTLRDALPLAEPDQIGRMKVAQHPGFGSGCGLAQQIAPHRDEFGAHVAGQLRAAIRQIPFEHQSDLDQERIGVEGGNGVAELRRQRQNFGQGFAVQRRQHVGRGLIALGDRRRRIAFDEARAAEILGDQESGVEVGVMDRGRREAALAQAPGDRDERLDVLGQMHRRAVGFAVIDRRTVGAPRRVHQDDDAVVADQPRIGTGRGVAGHALALCFRIACAVEKLTQRFQPCDLRGGLAVAGDLGGARGRSQRRTMAQRDVDAVGGQAEGARSGHSISATVPSGNGDRPISSSSAASLTR